VETTYTTVTNVFVQTNYTYIKHSVTNSDAGIHTNVILLAIRNSLPTRALAISSGAGSSYALLSDGRLWAWGQNSFGELGDGTTVGRATPGPVLELQNVLSVAGSGHHILAIDRQGIPWTWGANAFGQLGSDDDLDNDSDLPPLPGSDITTPERIIGLSRVARIAGGAQHSLALDLDGVVWSWGGGYHGQLGDGTFLNRITPLPLTNLTGAVRIAAGGWHSLVLKQDGTVWSWGRNDSGQLGDGGLVSQAVPVRVGGLGQIVDIAAGLTHSLALGADGSVWAWGGNKHGQLGENGLSDRNTPGRVGGLSGDRVVALAAGGWHSLALKSDGSVWTWGRGDFGQLGNGVGASQSEPQPVLTVSGAAAVAGGRTHSMALKADGTVWCWGNNEYGQLGDGEATVITNTVPFTNLVVEVVTQVITNIAYKTNISSFAQHRTVTNAIPIQTWIQRYFLDVVDYALPSEPVVRDPVNIPGLLRGLGRDGSVLYTVGQHYTANGAEDWNEWLDASAYDGVAAHLVDSLRLSSQWPHPVLVHRDSIFIGRPAEGTGTNQLQSWTLTDAGKFTQLGRQDLSTPAQGLAAWGDLLAVQTSAEVHLFNATDASKLVLIGAGGPSSCVGYNLESGYGSLNQGLWLPLGDFGVSFVPVSSLTQP
jgi:alpha-tubulin suppressor-like RCC1 family protein